MTEKYDAKPLNIVNTTANITAKDPLSADFEAFLIQHGYKKTDLPLAAWGLDELTLCALYYHSKLNVAKAQLALANAKIESAGLKQIPTVSGSIAHSDQANGDIRPWAYGLNIEIPVETGNKSEFRVEEAQQLANVARMDVADVAWQLRSQIAKDLIEYQQNIADTQLLQTELATQTEIEKMLQKRVDTGLASKTELSTAQLIALKMQSSLNREHAKFIEINTRLASDVGLTPEKFKQISLKPLDLNSTLTQQASILDTSFVNKELQEAALLNRIDIRRSLAKYAASEAKIKLEIAKQVPDISLTPGFIYEFGDKIWSLGFSSLLNLLNKNPSLINEAKQLREVEGAEFESLQAKIIGDLNQRYASYEAAKQALDQTQVQHSAQMLHMQKLQKQFDSGLIDRLELKQASLNNIVAQQQVSAAQFEVLKAANSIEDVMQRPIYTNIAMPNY